jgi:autophagy-related protein 2
LKNILLKEAIVSQRISIHFPVIRLSIRSPSPSSQSNRTGVLVINIHDLAINNAPENVRAKARFSTFNPASPQSPPVDGQLQMRAEFERIMFACSLVHEGTTSSFLSLGPLRYKDSTEVEANTSAVGSDQRLLPLLPCLKVTRSANVPSTSNPSTVALSLDLPSLFVDISKSQLDALQYWADNTTQLIDSALNTSSSSAKMSIEETGLIGSRFFAKSRSGSTSGLSSAVGEARAETVVKLTITECKVLIPLLRSLTECYTLAFVRIRLPRTADSSVVVRPFDITLSDLDALIEFEPEGEVTFLIPIKGTFV